MKVKVGKTYVDAAGCRVRIVAKIKAERPYLGIINWKTAKRKDQRNNEDDYDTYYADGTAFEGHKDFRLVKEI